LTARAMKKTPMPAKARTVMGNATGAGMPHAMLLSGPSGVGKTTLARIIAKGVQAQVIEVDAATYTGIDAMRSLSAPLAYQAMGEFRNKAVILDECHALSKPAWQSLLKVVEEPPEHLFFLLCTTELDKVPKTIVTRTHQFSLVSISSRALEDMLDSVVAKEKLKLPDGAVEYIARFSMGSARQALVFLSACAGAKTLAEVKALVATGADSTEAVELFRLLVSGKATFVRCLEILSKLDKGTSYESMRIGLMNYTAVVLMKAKSVEHAQLLLSILDAFSKPLNRSTERADFLLALGTALM